MFRAPRAFRGTNSFLPQPQWEPWDIYWTADCDTRNFGDLLLREAASGLFSRQRLIEAGYAAALFGGSCLDEYWMNVVRNHFPNSKVLFWGAGIRESVLDTPLDIPAPADIRGLRGPRSVEALGTRQ